MKKILTSLFILTILSFGVAPTNSAVYARGLKKAAPIEDEFVNSVDFPKVMPGYVKTAEPIMDDLVLPFEKSGTTLKLWARKTDVKNNVTINDELINQGFLSKFSGESILKRKPPVRLILETFFNRNLSKIKVKNNYDFTQAQIPVQLKVVNNLTTKSHILEGDIILFKTIKDVSLNGRILPKGTQVVGRVETVSESDKMGCPANIVVDNFHLQENPDICFYGAAGSDPAVCQIFVQSQASHMKIGNPLSGFPYLYLSVSKQAVKHAPGGDIILCVLIIYRILCGALVRRRVHLIQPLLCTLSEGYAPGKE